MEKKALGRGLEALLPVGEEKNINENQDVRSIQVDHILPSRYQPRRGFPEDELNKLADSVRQTGLLQPVVVRRKGDGFYELVAGERRWRAAKIAGLSNIPATVRNCSDQQAIAFALVENLQRNDLNPMETAQAYTRMLNEFGMTQDEVARQVGKDRSSVANFARLVGLPKDIQHLIEAGELSAGHAKVILSLEKAADQVRFAHRILAGQLSVRQAEKMAEREAKKKKTGNGRVERKPYGDLEEKIQRRLGTKITIQKRRRGGKIIIHYFSEPEFERIVDALLG